MFRSQFTVPVADDVPCDSTVPAVHLLTVEDDNYYVCCSLILAQLGMRAFLDDHLYNRELEEIALHGAFPAKVQRLKEVHRSQAPCAFVLGADETLHRSIVVGFHARSVLAGYPVHYLAIVDAMHVAGVSSWKELRAHLISDPIHLLEAAIACVMVTVYDGDDWVDSSKILKACEL